MPQVCADSDSLTLGSAEAREHGAALEGGRPTALCPPPHPGSSASRHTSELSTACLLWAHASHPCQE